MLDAARLLHDAGVHQTVKVLDVIDLLAEKLELVEHAGFVAGQFGKLCIVKNLHQRNLKGRHRGHAIHGEAAFAPLAGDARIAVEKGGDKVGFVAVAVILGLLAGIVAEQGLGEIMIDGGGETAAKHLRE